MATLSAQPIMLENAAEHIDLDFIHDPDSFAERTARAGKLPDPTGICVSIAHAAVDAFHGTRPVTQLARLVAPAVYEQLAARSRAQQEVNKINGVVRVSGTRPINGGVMRPTTRVLRARVLRVSPVAAEATVIVLDGARVRAAALRVEEFRGRWRATVLQIG